MQRFYFFLMQLFPEIVKCHLHACANTVIYQDLTRSAETGHFICTESLMPMHQQHFLPIATRNVSHQQQPQRAVTSKVHTPSSSFPVRCSTACGMHLISVSNLDFNMSKPIYFWLVTGQARTCISRKPTRNML